MLRFGAPCMFWFVCVLYRQNVCAYSIICVSRIWLANHRNCWAWTCPACRSCTHGTWSWWKTQRWIWSWSYSRCVVYAVFFKLLSWIHCVEIRSSAVAERPHTTLCIVEYFTKSLKIIRSDTFECDIYKSLLKLYLYLVTFMKLYLYLVPFVRYSTSNERHNIQGVIQGGWKWQRSIDILLYTTYCCSAIVSIALSCTIFELYDVK